MPRYFLVIVCFVVACVFAANNSMVLAQNPSSGGDQQGGTVLENIKTSIIQAIGAEAGTVEVTTSGNIFSVARVNSNMNNSTHGGRDNEATAIGSIISKAIADKPEFKDIIVIRVQYLVRSGSAAESKVVDAIEFRKNPKGTFEFHAT